MLWVGCCISFRFSFSQRPIALGHLVAVNSLSPNMTDWFCLRHRYLQIPLAHAIPRFGAVLEEFEVRDALSSVFATKLENYTGFA